MPLVPNFMPSINGLWFTNSWPPQPDIVVDVPPFGQVAIGDARNGLCGGMVFTVRDVFEAGQPPLTNPQPSQGQPLFDYIVRRLFDSFNLPGGVLKYMEWMNTPDHDTGIGPFVRRGLAWRTIIDEGPRVQADIDSGHPSPLGLVTVASVNPGDLGQNHQVLAYGYDLVGNTMTLRVYDPNSGADDNVRVSFDVSNPTHTTPIAHNVNIAHPIRGFFRVDYVFADPSGLQPQPPAAWWTAGTGQLQPSASDRIDWALQQGVVDPATVEFVLEAGLGITWRKVLNVPDGLGNSWDIFTQDAKTSDAVSLWADQVNNGQSLSFSKAGFLGIVTPVTSLGNLGGLPASSRLIFRWVQD